MTKQAAFAGYLAFGDSMSMDLYPALDVGETDVAVALERDPSAGRVSPLGAASLFFSNDARFPEFAEKDLATRCPGVTYRNLCEDGATIGDVFGSQLPQVETSDAKTLITLSIGGNDLLSAFAATPDPDRLRHVVRDVGDAYEFLVESLRRVRPRSVLLLTTVYDPSDGTGVVGGVFDGEGPLPLQFLHALNERIAAIAAATRDARVADAHAHFLGHGASAPEKERWYWRRSMIEPGLTGASELRRVWWDCVMRLA